MRLTLGEILYRFRVQRELEAKQICRGLCSTSAMDFYESGERVPDTLLFECIIERMGVSPEEFSLMVAEEEYIYHVWREKVYRAIENEDWEYLGSLLQSNITKNVYCNKKLEKQFFTYVNAIYWASQGKYNEAVNQLKIAEEQTIPDREVLLKRNVLLGSMELNILMLYIYYGINGNILDVIEGFNLFQMLEKYIYNGILDVNEQEKCYPKLICIGLHCFKEQMMDEEWMLLCERAVQMLRTNKDFYDIVELLRLYVSLLEKSKSSELYFYKKQYEVFCDLMESENIDTHFRPEVRNVRKPKIFMIHEFLFTKRKEHELTQTELSEGICEPETYSRIENGKRAPSRKNFRALAERLDINWCDYRGELDTCNWKAYKLRRKHRLAEIEGRYQDSVDILLELEKCLDMSNIINYQYVKSHIWLAKYRLGILEADETYEKLDTLLKESKSMNLNTSYLVYYTQTELEIIAYMAQLLRQQKKYQEGVVLIENVLKQMENSKVRLEYQWNGASFLLRVLCGLYFELGEYDITIRIASYVKHIMIGHGEGANLAAALDEIADALEHKGEQYSQEYKKLYRHAYYLADFFKEEKVIEVARRYYEDNFEFMMVWY